MTPLPELVKRIDEALRSSEVRCDNFEKHQEMGGECRWKAARRDLRELVERWPPTGLKNNLADVSQRNTMLAALEPFCLTSARIRPTRQGGKP